MLINSRHTFPFISHIDLFNPYAYSLHKHTHTLVNNKTTLLLTIIEEIDAMSTTVRFFSLINKHFLSLFGKKVRRVRERPHHKSGYCEL